MRQEFKDSSGAAARPIPTGPDGPERNVEGTLAGETAPDAHGPVKRWGRAVLARPYLWLPLLASIMMTGFGQLQRPIVEAALYQVEGFQRPVLHHPLSILPNPLFDAWDSVHYRALAREYTMPAWPPLYPLTLRLVGALPFSGDAFRGAAQLINLACMIALAALLPLYLRLYAPGRAAPGHPAPAEERTVERDVAVLLFVFFFPGHNVFFAAYSEGLFLVLSLAALVFYRRKQWTLTGTALGLTVLTRYQGILLALAVPTVYLFERWREERQQPPGKSGNSVPLAVRAPATPAGQGAVWSVLLRLSTGWIVFVLWIPLAVLWTGQSPFQAVSPWTQDLLANHIRDGMEPHLWVLSYLTWTGPALDRAWFLALLAGTVFLVWKREHMGALFLALFLLSLTVHVYRPFAFSRYVSALAPVYVLFDLWIARHPTLRMLVIPAAVLYSVHTQLLLFTTLFGEP